MKTNAYFLSLLLLLSGGVALSGAEPPVPRFRVADVDTKIEIGYGVAVADVDGDSKPDILLADKKQFVWYRNPTWEKFILTENLTKEDNVCIAAADIDGDGKAEVAVGAGWNPGDTVSSGAVFYLIPPKDRTQKWEAVPLHHEPTVHRMRWVKNWQGEYELVVVPLHGTGNKNGQGEGVKILGYKKPVDAKDSWTTRLMNDALHMTHNFDPVQWDDDPAKELLMASREGVFVLNWDAEASALKLAQLSGTESGGAGEVRLGKLTGGKRIFASVEPMHGTNLVIYSPPVDAGEKALWQRNVLDSSLVDGHALACGDLLGIGSDQIVVGWRAMNKSGVKVGIKFFTPLDAEGKNWRQTLIDDNTMACEDLTLADLNGDGKLDIVAAGRATKNVKVYFTEGAAKAR